MLKKVIKKACERSKLLNAVIYEPYASHCERRRIAGLIEEWYDLKNASGWLNEIHRCGSGSNFWFLLEQGHNNIGDIAIGIAEKRFFEENYPDVSKHYIYEAVYAKYKKEIAKQIRSDDVIILRGGGSIGNTVNHEKHREEIIKKFRNDLIVSMPQTMSFPNTPKGNNEKNLASKIYGSNKNLLLVAREEKSFYDMKGTFSDNDILLTPDIVMSLNCSNSQENRNGILLCFRTDWEKSLSNDDIHYIEQECNLFTNSVEYTDMYAKEEFVPFEKREEVFNKKIEQFKHASLVITDRLHGMVFSAISGTACIALSNYNHKVEETYKWLKHLPYICFCHNAQEACKTISSLYGIQGNYDNGFTVPYYKKISEYIDKHMREKVKKVFGAKEK